MDRTPVWQRVYEDLRQQIMSGEVAIGQRLPSDSELAEKYQLNHLTIRKGVARLVSEGLIERRVGAGSFVRDPKPRASAVRSVALVAQDMLTGTASPHAFLGCAMRGLREALPQERYHLELLDYASHHFAVLEPLLEPGRVGGVVIAGGIADEDRHGIVRRIRSKGLALVIAGGRFDLECPVVRIDRLDLLGQAVEGALRAGHRRLGLVLYGSDDCDELRSRFAAILAAAGLDPGMGTVHLVPDSGRPDRMPVLPPGWRGAGDGPTCMIVGDETLARAVVRSAGPELRLGRDLSLIALTDNTPGAFQLSLCAPDTGELQTRLFAEAGRQLVAGLAQTAETKQVVTRIKGRLVLGESLGAPPVQEPALAGLR